MTLVRLSSGHEIPELPVTRTHGEEYQVHEILGERQRVSRQVLSELQHSFHADPRAGMVAS